MMWNGDVASNGQFLCPPSDMSWGFDSASKSLSERIPQSLRLGLDDEPKSSTGVLTSDPTADWSALPGYKASLILISLITLNDYTLQFFSFCALVLQTVHTLFETK